MRGRISGVLAFVLVFGVVAQAAAASTTIHFFAPPRMTLDGKDINETLVEMFNSSQNDIIVEYTPATGDWVEKVSVEFLAGTAPDVVAGWESFFRNWLEQGHALPLDRYLDAELINDFVPGHLRLFQVDGKQMALPHYTGVSGLFYNVDMFDAAGVPYPDGTWTWDTIIEAGRKLTRRSGDQVVQWGFDVNGGWDRVIQFIWENGGRVIDEGAVVGNRIYLDEPEAIEALEFQHSLIWEYEIAPPYPFIGRWSHDMFWNGTELAMWQTGSWDVSATFTNCPTCNWNVSVRPRGRTGIASAIHTADGYMVYAGTRHPDEAVRFLLFLVGEEAQRYQMIAGNLQPARLSLGAEYARETEAAQKGINLEVFIEQTAYARPAPLFTKQTEVGQLLWPAIEESILKNERPVRQVFEELTARVNAILAQP